VKPVVIHSEARAELDDAIAYYEAQRQGLGRTLQAEIEQAVSRIQSRPGLGTPYKATAFRYVALRRFPYVIYYLELDTTLWVAAIAHTRRRPGYWKRRKVE
jgi:toxin ParE1/3/4